MGPSSLKPWDVLDCRHKSKLRMQPHPLTSTIMGRGIVHFSPTHPCVVRIMKLQVHTKTLHILLRTARLGPAVSFRYSSTASTEDLLPKNWTELGEQIQNQLIYSGSQYLRSNVEKVKESLAKRGMEADVDELVSKK